MFQTNNIILSQKPRKLHNKCKASKWKEIIWRRAEINELKNREVIEKVNEIKRWLFKTLIKLTKL